MVEVDGRDNIELGMDDIDDNIEDIVNLCHEFLTNLVCKITFGVEMVKISKERVFSNYF